jgi:RNA polymerase sigma-70 factor (ECF subfamily)
MNSADHFETIVSEHSDSLFRFAMSLTRSESDAKDLTQHTFYMWAIRGHQLRDLSKVKPWLFTTLHRAFLAGQRRNIRFPLEELDGVAEELPVFTPVPGRGLDGSDVLTALERIDERFQAAVALFYLEDYSYQEIAVILEVPVGTVKSRISRGIAQLRELIESKSSRDLPSGRHPYSTVSDSI